VAQANRLTLLAQLRAKVQRDRRFGWRFVLSRGAGYAWDLCTAPLYLRGVDHVGLHARTRGCPRIRNAGFMSIGSGVVLRSVNVPVELHTGPAGTLTLGDQVRVNFGVSIAAESRITIGDRVRIGPYVMLADTDFHDLHVRSARAVARPLVIEDDVWIGARATVLKGVRIGRGAVVGAAAVVTRDVPPFTIVAGVPARRIGMVDSAHLMTGDAA